MTRAPLVLPVLLFAMACRERPTQFLVVVYTDFEVPEELDRVLIEARDELDNELTLEFADADTDESSSLRSLSFAAIPDGDHDDVLDIRVTGLLGTHSVVMSSVQTTFIQGRALRLPVYLLRSCRDLGCTDDGRRCEVDGSGNAACSDGIHVPAETLLGLGDDDPEPRIHDAGSEDAASPDAGTADAGPSDGGGDDGGSSDAGNPDAGPSACPDADWFVGLATTFTASLTDLSQENFNDISASVPNGGWSACGGPLTSSTMSSCANPGDVDARLSIVDSLGGLSVFDDDYYANFNDYYIGVSASAQTITINFDPPVRAVGVQFLSDDEVASEVTVNVKIQGEGGSPLASMSRTSSLDMKSFVGVRCGSPVIYRLVLDPTNGSGPYTFADEIMWEQD